MPVKQQVFKSFVQICCSKKLRKTKGVTYISATPFVFNREIIPKLL